MTDRSQQDRVERMRRDGADVVSENNFDANLLHSISADPAFSGLKALDVTFKPGECVDLATINCFASLEELVLVRVDRSVGAIKTSELEQLRKVELYDWCRIRDVSFLEGSRASIQELVISNCPNLESLAGVEHLEHLTSVTIIGAKSLHDISGLSQLGHLEYLRLAEVPSLRDITPIGSIGSLRSLGLPKDGAFPPSQRELVKTSLRACKIFIG